VIQQVPYSGRKTHPHKSCAGSNTSILDVPSLDPKGILARLQKIYSKFLWKGNKQGNLFTWVKWDTIARPKKWGGWGIKRLDFFAKALAAKLGWQLITSHSL